MLFAQTTTMLRGNIPAKVDEKGRLKIPAAFLEELKEHGDRFYVTSEDGVRARIYPMKAWGEIEEKVGEDLLPITRPRKNS